MNKGTARSGRTILFALLLCLAPGQVLAERCAASFMPQGNWLTSPVDKAEHANEEFNDREWTALATVPEGQSKQIRDGISWYRLHFDASAWTSCALYLGKTQEVDEVFLNGVRIGGSGRMGSHWFDYTSAYRMSRAYPIPDGILREGQNVLAVRLLSFYLDAGIATDEVSIGPEMYEIGRALEQNLATLRIETAVLAINLLGALLLGVTAFSRSGSMVHGWLSLLLLCLAAAYAIESLTLLELRLQLPWLNRVTFLIMAVMPTVYLRYHYALFGGYPQWTTSALALAPAPLAMLHQFNIPTQLVATSYDLWHISFLPIGVLVLYKLVRNSIASLPNARATLLAVMAPIGGFALAVMGVNILPGSVDPIEVGGVCMTLILLINFAQRYSRDHESLMRLSKGILEAQDQERKRIARELHDGLGQRMVATRLMLDALHMSNPDSQLEEPVAELRESVNELRAMVYGLRPASLEDHDLVTALRTYASRTTELTGTLVEVFAEDMAFDLPTEIEEHIFRIFQEAINNAIRHGLASTVKVSFECHAAHIVLKIEDNGDGFKVQDKEGAGVGLTAMAERARVCHGRLQVTSKQGSGTSVVAEIPYGFERSSVRIGNRAGDIQQ